MKRYDCCPVERDGEWWSDAAETKDGSWVKWSDVEGLVDAIEDLNRSSYATWVDTLRLRQLIQDRNDK